MILGRMLDNTCDAYIIPSNYKDFIFEGCYADENMPNWFESLDILLDDREDLILNVKGSIINLTPGTVVVYDTNPYVENIVGIYSNVDEASEHCYIKGKIN